MFFSAGQSSQSLNTKFYDVGNMVSRSHQLKRSCRSSVIWCNWSCFRPMQYL